MIKEGAEENILKINELRIVLGGRVILDKISFDVKESEMIGIVGISGVGKTSLLNSIIGYYSVSRGTIFYKSTLTKKFVSALENLDNFKKLVGFSAQSPSFYPELTVIENLEYFSSLYDIPEQIKKQNINRALELVELQDFVSMPSKNLSGGMKKRLDIACSIVHAPKILLLDEPTSDMDPLLRVQIWRLMENINRRGTTVIVASHFLSEVEHMCDRIIFLRNRHIEFVGTPNDFRNLHSKVKEIHITTRKGSYDITLKKIMNMPFLEVKQVFRKKGRIVVHSKEDEKIIRSAIGRMLQEDKNISDIEIIEPSLDTIFKLFVEK